MEMIAYDQSRVNRSAFRHEAHRCLSLWLDQPIAFFIHQNVADKTRIFTCPLASPRAAWAWYALDGRPTSFAVTSLPGDQGFGLFAVLDYRDWLPGHQAPASAFDKPAQCQPLHRLPSRSIRTDETDIALPSSVRHLL
jgi:hypothetical protein